MPGGRRQAASSGAACSFVAAGSGRAQAGRETAGAGRLCAPGVPQKYFFETIELVRFA